MVKILFVCLGNICRSPMAEFVMRDMVKKSGRESEFYIESAATSGEEEGNPVYPPAEKMLSSHGIDCSGKFARRLKRSDYDEFDFLIAMDSSNLRDMKRICGGDPDNKITMLLDRSVADPWYTGDFSATWNDVNEGCRALLEKI